MAIRTARPHWPVALALLSATTIVVANPPATEPVSASDWMSSYYLNPTPGQAGTRLNEFAADGAFRMDGGNAMVQSFLARLMADNPGRLDGWVGAIGKLDPADRTLPLAALRQADTDATRAALKRLNAGDGPDAKLAADAMAVPVVRPETLKPADMTAGDVAACWGAYFATGKADFADAVFRCAGYKPRRAAFGDAGKAGESARASARVLARTDPKINALLAAYVAAAPAAEQPQLRGLIDRSTATAPTTAATRGVTGKTPAVIQPIRRPSAGRAEPMATTQPAFGR